MFSPTVIDKAREALTEGRVTPLNGETRIVQSATGRDSYRVTPTKDPGTGVWAWIDCTCLAGRNARGGVAKCHHAVAVMMTLQQEAGS